MAPNDSPQLPERYVDARLVARGGMGEVWRVHDAQLGRDVAIKRIALGDATESEATRRARFEREARAIARLSSHPGVVTVYDIGTAADGAPFLAMEWLGGGSLRERIGTGATAPAVALAVLAQVADALDVAHAAGVVHRDVKPDNVLFDADGSARVSDFGIASLHDDASGALTQTGAVVGTVHYMSPEQARGLAAVPASDQYALAAMAFSMLVGRRPFERDSAIAELAAHVGEAPPSASLLRRDLGPWCDEVFDRALAKEPSERYVSCRAFVGALSGALDGSRARAQVGARTAVTTQLPTVQRERGAPARRAARTTAPRRERRGRSFGVFLVVIALLLVGAVGAMVLPDRSGSATDDGRSDVTDARAGAAVPEPKPEPEQESVDEPEPDFADPAPVEPEPQVDTEAIAQGVAEGIDAAAQAGEAGVDGAVAGIEQCADVASLGERLGGLASRRDALAAAQELAETCAQAGGAAAAAAAGAGRERGGADRAARDERRDARRERARAWLGGDR